MALFEEEYPVIADHIANCDQLEANQRQECFETINGDGTRPRNELAIKANEYFRTHKMLGEEFRDRAALGKLGHLHLWTALEANSDVTESLDESYLDLGRIRESYKAGEVEKLIEMLQCLEDVPFKYVVWGFHNGLQPFMGVDVERLPCRLALNSIDINDYLPFEINVPPTVAVHEATAFDAGFFDLWCPGGLTCPLHECDGETGLREAVMPGDELDNAWVSFRYVNFPEF